MHNACELADICYLHVAFFDLMTICDLKTMLLKPGSIPRKGGLL